MKPSNTTRLQFSKVSLSDSKELFASAFGSKEVTKFLQWECHDYIDQTRLLIDEMCQMHERGEKYFWVARSLIDQALIGLGSLKPDDETAWLGFLIAVEHHRKGYGLEILQALEDAAFCHHQGVSAAVAPSNWASLSLLKKRDWIKGDFVDGLTQFHKTGRTRRGTPTAARA